MGTYLLDTGALGLGAFVGLGLLTPEISLPKFHPLHVGEGPAGSASALPPTTLDGCGFFNSVAVRLPLNSMTVLSYGCSIF